MGRDRGQGLGWPHLSWDKERKRKLGIPEVWGNDIHLSHLKI